MYLARYTRWAESELDDEWDTRLSIKLQVVGDPVAHSLSPQIHADFASQLGHDVIYGKERVTIEEFDQKANRFRSEGGLGMNVTVPLKTAAFNYVEVRDEVANAAGAVNTIHFEAGRIVGYNTDGWGLVTDLTHRWHVVLEDQVVLLLGAGGATRGVILPLLQAGVQKIIVANRTLAKAQQLCHDLAPFAGDAEVVASALNKETADLEDEPVGLIVNATSIGLSDDVLELPISEAQLGEAFCYDMGYGANAGFLRQIQGRARVAVDGLGMLVEQAAKSYEIWLGTKPKTQGVYEALRA